MSDQTEKTDIKALIELCPTLQLVTSKCTSFVYQVPNRGGGFDERSLPGGGALDHYS